MDYGLIDGAVDGTYTGTYGTATVKNDKIVYTVSATHAEKENSATAT